MLLDITLVFFPNHVASNSLYSKCAILKSVPKELTLRGISNAKNHAETLQVYLVVEDNVLISTRRGDWFQWVHLISSSLLITRSLPCPAVVSLFND